MAIALVAYCLMLLLVLWSHSIYPLVLIARANARRRARHTLDEQPLPRVAMIVCCKNEASCIENKFNNCEQLAYKGFLRFIFADGCSDDGTDEIIDRLIAGKEKYQLLRTRQCGKINQLNQTLPTLRGQADIIVCSDADALLETDVVEEIAAEFQANPSVAVVGACIKPNKGFLPESRYWEDQNLIRLLESAVATSSIVVAPCYAFRSSLIDAFPQDCIADDIFVAFKANTLGLKTVYSGRICGHETRTPLSLLEFLHHKFRKGNAFILELFRFSRRLGHMRGWWQLIFLTKMLQIVIVPWIAPCFALTTLCFLAFSKLTAITAIAALFILFISLVITSLRLRRYRHKVLPSETQHTGIRLYTSFLLINCVLLAVGLSFPFYKQSSCYRRFKRSLLRPSTERLAPN